MSADVSPAMQAVTMQNTVQHGLNALFEAGVVQNAVATGDGTNVTVLVLEEGNVPVGGADGLTQAPLPTGGFVKFTQGSQTSGVMNASYAAPRLVVPAGTTSIQLPDGGAATSDLEFYNPNASASEFVGYNGQNVNVPSVLPGETVKLSFFGGNWLQC